MTVRAAAETWRRHLARRRCVESRVPCAVGMLAGGRGRVTWWDCLEFIGMHRFGGADRLARSASTFGSTLLFSEDAGRIGECGNEEIGRERCKLDCFGGRGRRGNCAHPQRWI